MRARLLLAMMAAIPLRPVAPATPPDPLLAGLTEDNTLLLFRARRPTETRQVKVSRVRGQLIGIDYRPANGKLYGLTTANNVYTIDAETGAASLVSSLTLAFDGGVESGFDFNPQADRLRVVGANGQNLRVHVDVGAVAIDGALAYSGKDRHRGRRPTLAGAAYTSNVPHAPATKLFEIDAALDVLVLQEPPNDGVLTTVGPLGADFDVCCGFDIVTEGGADAAFAASGGMLYAVDLTRGTATAIGPIGAGVRLLGLAVLPP